MPLDHDDLILLARLLGHHTNGDAYTKLSKVADKLLGYVDRMTEGGSHALEPLDLRLRTCSLYPERVMFQEALKPGEFN